MRYWLLPFSTNLEQLWDRGTSGKIRDKLTNTDRLKITNGQTDILFIQNDWGIVEQLGQSHMRDRESVNKVPEKVSSQSNNWAIKKENHSHSF